MNMTTRKLWYGLIQSRKKGEYLWVKYEDRKLLHYLDWNRVTRIINILKWEKMWIPRLENYDMSIFN